MKSGGPSSPAKNLKAGRGNGRRFTVGESLEVTATFDHGVKPRRVWLHTDLPEGTWRSLDLGPTSDGYRLRLPLSRAGKFHGQIRWEASGETFFDAEGFLYFAVDGALMGNLRLYTLIPTATGTVDDWIARIPDIARLGFNAVHLLPVTAMDASGSPYSARDLFNLDPRFAPGGGGMESFLRFTKALKAAGLKLCVDLVLNHVGITGLMAREHPEYFKGDPKKPDGIKRAGAAAGDGWIEWTDLALLDFDTPDPAARAVLWDTMTDYARLWAGLAAETGGLIRLDNLHSTHPGFLAHCLGDLKRRFTDLHIFSELFASPEVVHQRVWDHDLSLCLATPWTSPYAHQVRGQLGWLHHQTGVRYLFPLASHDSGAPAQEYGGVESTRARYLVACLFSTGATGAVQGNEDGVPKKIEFIGDDLVKPYPKDPDLRDFFRLANGLHQGDGVFRTAGNLDFVDHEHGAVLAAVRRRDGRQVLLIANLDPKGGHPLVLHGKEVWGDGTVPPGAVARDLFTGEDRPWNGDAMHFDVPPAAAWAFDLIVKA